MKKDGELTVGKRHVWVSLFGRLVRKPVNKLHWFKPR